MFGLNFGNFFMTVIIHAFFIFRLTIDPESVITEHSSCITGAHGRFTPAGGMQREARVQTLVPDKWMSDVEKCGHGTHKITKQSEQTV